MNILGQKIILDSSQYDFYQFELNFKKIYGENQKIKTHLITELEKIHPRFSVQCRWEYFLSVKNKKIFANVIVIDKFLLSKCIRENKRRFFIEKPRRRIFASKKKFVFICFLMILGIFAGKYFFVKYSKSMESQKSILEKSSFQVEENFENQFLEESVENFDLLSLFTDFIETIRAHDKNVFFESLSIEKTSDFDWIKFSVKGVFPEEIEKFFSPYFENEEIYVKFDHIFYENQEPKIQGTIYGKSRIVENEIFLEEVENPLVDYRNYLMKNNIVLEVENHDTMTLGFYLSKSKLKRIFSDYEKFEMKNLRQINIKSNYGDENIFMELGFFTERDFGIGSGFSLKDIFTDEMQVLLSKKKPEVQSRKIEKKLENQMDEKQIVGKVKSENGKVIYLVKDKDGKIIKE